MKCKVIIEKHGTTIVLTPENDFEVDVFKKAVAKEGVTPIYETSCQITSDSNWGSNIKMDVYLTKTNPRDQ